MAVSDILPAAGETLEPAIGASPALGPAPTPAPRPASPAAEPPPGARSSGAPPPPSARLRQRDDVHPAAHAAFPGLPLPGAVRPTGDRLARPHRRRRSAAPLATLPHPVDLPEDAPGRIIVTTSSAPAALVREAGADEVEGEETRHLLAVDVRTESWWAVAVVAVALTALFILGLRLTS